MKMLNVKAAFRLLLTSICSLSVLATPSKASAESCCAQPQDNCCDTGCGWGKTALFVGSAIVAGGIAGAIAGHSTKSHHHHDSCSCSPGEVGPIGPTGATGATGADASNPFVVDANAVLTFSVPLGGLTLTSSAPPPLRGPVQVIPFVSTPDGRIIDGTVITSPVSNPAGVMVFPAVTGSVTVPLGDVVFGTYHFGLHINAADYGGSGITVAISGPTVNPIVTVELNGVIPPEEVVALAPFVVVTAPGIPLENNNIQLETEYSYDPNNP